MLLLSYILFKKMILKELYHFNKKILQVKLQLLFLLKDLKRIQ